MKIKNWSKFQHFKDRRPPWIKLHRETLEQRDINKISDRSFRILIGLWLLASEDKDMEGNLPSIEDIAFRLRMTDDEINKYIQELRPWVLVDDDDVLSERYHDDAPETEAEAYSEEKKESCLVQADQNDAPVEPEQNPSPEDTFLPDPEAALRLVGKADAGADEPDLLAIPKFLRRGEQRPPGVFPTLKQLGPGPSRKYPAEFERFWSTFPKRATDTKAQAYTAWLKGVKAVGVDVLQSAAEAYANFCAAKDHPSKLVQSWVNAEGWTADYGNSGSQGDGEQSPYVAALAQWHADCAAAEEARKPLPPRPVRDAQAQVGGGG